MSTSHTSAENDSRQGWRPIFDDHIGISVAAFSAADAFPSERAARCAGRRRARLITALILWCAGVAAGCWSSFQYETTAADTAPALDRWPANDLCSLSRRRPTLVMFAHPRCPCTRASLNELELLMTHCQDRVEAHVIFLQPRSFTAEWARTDLWNSAAAIPGVTTHLDLDGTVQERFAARVSGETFLYDPAGKLAFHGGITASRGHAGDNDGRCALESLLIDDACRIATTPVFGCALNSPDAACRKCDTACETRPER